MREKEQEAYLLPFVMKSFSEGQPTHNDSSIFQTQSYLRPEVAREGCRSASLADLLVAPGRDLDFGWGRRRSCGDI